MSMTRHVMVEQYRQMKATVRLLQEFRGMMLRLCPEVKNPFTGSLVFPKDIPSEVSLGFAYPVSKMLEAVRNRRALAKPAPFVTTKARAEITQENIRHLIEEIHARYTLYVVTMGEPNIRIINTNVVSSINKTPIYAVTLTLPWSWRSVVLPLMKLVTKLETDKRLFILHARKISDLPYGTLYRVQVARHERQPKSHFQRVHTTHEYCVASIETGCIAFGETLIQAERNFGLISRKFVKGKLAPTKKAA